MPIASRTLESVQPSVAGTVLASFLATDDKGRAWRRSRARFANEAAAVAASDAFNWTDQLKDVDFSDLLLWVEGLNTVASFNLTNRDITEALGEKFILTYFAKSSGEDAIKVAWWLDSLNTGAFNTIRNRAGFTGDQGSIITQRFTFLLLAEPWWDVRVEVD